MRALLGLLFAWALVSQLPYSSLLLYLQVHSAHSVQVPFEQTPYSRVISEVSPVYDKAGLRAGDQVIGVNGTEINSATQEARLFLDAKPNDTVAVSIRRGGEIKTLTFALRPHVVGAGEWPFTIIASVLLPVACLLVGFYIAFARPTDPLAWIAMAMLASFSTQLADPFLASLLPSPWRDFCFVYEAILRNTWPLWMVMFGFYFPLPFPFIRRKPWIVWLLAVPSIALTALSIYGNFGWLRDIDPRGRLAQLEHLIYGPRVLWDTLLVFAFFACLRWKAKIIKQPDARRRMLSMIYGCTLALTPSLLIVISDVHLLPLLPPLPDWLEAVCLAMLILFPVTMAYVIVVQRAMDVRMAIRSGVRYAFASRSLRVVQGFLVGVVALETFRLAQQANHRTESFMIAAFGALLVATIRRLTQWSLEWMDRRFFREAYNAERILTDLSMSVAGIRDVKELLETVTKRISESLHVPGIAVFLEESGAYRPAYAMGAGLNGAGLDFKPEATIVQFLKRQRAPSKIYFEDPQNWIHGAPEAEQAKLRHLDTQVLLPLALKDRLLGIISLSGKRSEEPYSRADLQMLGAVASQTGMALENAELTESVRRQIAQRERLDQELEIARDVQQRLFPQRLPIVSGLDFAGYCRPAEGVGGDYYDFIHLPDTSLGIAVGDVSGKGIAAALMMASLQASLRGQTIKPCETLSEMIGHINGLMYEASAENRYATFFYAQYHPETRALRYVNAGHNAPMVWRQVDGKHEFLRLEDGGTVVGLFPESPFCEGLMQLEKGDVVIAFTDGISEAMNGADEEFEEERLMAALCKLRAVTAAEMISQILGEVDGFTAGARQNDDMTLVVVRVQ